MASQTRLRIAIAVVSALVLAALAGTVLATTAIERTERHTRTLHGPVSQIVVDSEGGDVRLRTSSNPEITVRETRRFSSREPRVSIALNDGVLRIAVECGGLFTLSCSDDLELSVPRTIRTAAIELDSGDAELSGLDGDRFTVDADSGDVTARQMRGALALSADSGDVHAEDVVGPLALDTDSGDVTASRVQADTVTATTDSGDVELALEAAPSAVEAEADSGDVMVALPRGPYRLVTETDSGDVHLSGVLPDDAASRRVVARTDSGDVSVSGRS